MTPEKATLSLGACHRIIDLGHDAVAINDREGNCVYVSSSYRDLLGYTVKELIGRPGMDIVHPDDVPRARELFSLVLADPGRTFKGDLRLRHKNGDTMVVSYRVTNLLDDPQLRGIVVTFHDVTKQRALEERYTTLVEKGNDGILIIQDGLMKYANVGLLEMLGYAREEILGTPAFAYIAPEYRKTASERYVKRLQGMEVPSVYESALVAKDGHYIPMEVSAAAIEYKGKPAIMGIVRDLTERKEAEKKAREHEAMLEAFFNATRDLVGIVNPDDDTIVYVNDALAQSLGRPKSDLIGVNYADSIPPDIAESRWAKVRETAGTKKPMVFTDERNGRQFNNRFYPIMDDHGHVKYVAGFITDITEEKQMRERLMEQEKLAALGQIAAVIAHELNTPLATIDLTAQMLKETLPDTYSADLDTIKKEAKRASRLVKETLGFTRMETLHLQKTRIKPIMETALKRQQSLHDTTHITFDVDITDAPIRADDDKLAIALENIIKNAIQAQQTPQAKHHIAIHTTPDTENLTITIRDTGVGMDDHTKNNLFKPFFTTRDKTEGTGLGLYITHWITTNHQGSITAASTEGEGTTFTITLP
ncbi:MAG: PAS domain S-box protein, partial [Thermoplasmatota archaeon]